MTLYLFKNKPTQPLYDINVVDEKRKWLKNGKHKLTQTLEFVDSKGIVIGKGKIIRTMKI